MAVTVVEPGTLRAAWRSARVAGVALAATAVVGGGAFAAISTLPRPTDDERLAVQVVARLHRPAAGGAPIHVGRGSFVASCRRLSGGRTLVLLDNGERFVVSRTRVHDRTPAPDGRTLTGRSARDRELVAVKAALAGIHNLYATSLRGRLMRGADVVAGRRLFRGRLTYRIRVGKDRPAVEILVAADTLAPVAATYRSRRVAAWSRLLPPPARPRARC